MTLEMDLNLHGQLVTCLTASISYITTERLLQPHRLDLLPLENDYNYRAATGKCTRRCHGLLYGPPGVDLLG